jgi:hypothetical protein
MQCCAGTTRKVAHSHSNMSEQDEQVVKSEGEKATNAAESLAAISQAEASPAGVHEYAAQMVRKLQKTGAQAAPCISSAMPCLHL